MRQFDLEEERIRQEIVKLGARRVLIQLPEGLKREGLHIANIVEKTGAQPMISADPCYGACDLATAEAESLGADLIVHFGHTKLLRYERVPTIYVEARATAKVGLTVEKALPLLEDWHKIGLVTTVQHVQTLDNVREFLLHAGKIVIIGDSQRTNYPGQVVGCDYSNAESIARDVEAFVFIGGGRFHALGVALSTFRPTIVADPYEKKAYSVDEEARLILRQRWANIEDARKGKTFAVLVGLKPGQRRLEEALLMKDKLGKYGRKTYLFVVRNIYPEVLMEFSGVDAYVNTACPRISFDDAPDFRKPLLTMSEALVVCGELSWKELCRRGLFGN